MKIIFPIKLYRKLRAYVDQVEGEISGMGEIKKEIENGETKFIVSDIRIFRQSISSGHTTLDRKDLGKFYDAILREGKSMKEWRLWWHSHNDMGTFFSGIDTNTIEEFDIESPEENWILALVTNKSEDTLIRCDIFQPIRYTINEIEVEIVYEDEEIRKEVKKEIEEKVKAPSLWNDVVKGVKDIFFPEIEAEIEIESIKSKKGKKDGNKRRKN